MLDGQQGYDQVMSRTRCTVVALGLLAIAVTADVRADVVKMIDGRVFQGEIVEQDDNVIAIDTQITPSIRTTLRLPRLDVHSFERRPLPDGYFDPPPAAPRVSDPAKFTGGETLYLEVPIVGRFGTDIFADGLADILRYARRYRIGHIVFVVDSEGGAFEEVEAVYAELRRNRRVFTYHALVRRCLDAALAVPVWCDTVHLLPGGVIGGAGTRTAASRDSAEAAEDELLRAQIANEVVREADLRGEVGDMVRAMIDPFQSLAAWRDADGEIVFDAVPAAGVPDDAIIFQVGPGRLLSLTFDQAVALGVQPFDGGVADLGALLELDGWAPESDFGRRTMTQTAGRKAKDAAEASVRFAASVEEILRRRAILERNLEENLRRVAEWDPSEGSYDFYSRRYGWGVVQPHRQHPHDAGLADALAAADRPHPGVSPAGGPGRHGAGAARPRRPRARPRTGVHAAGPRVGQDGPAGEVRRGRREPQPPMTASGARTSMSLPQSGHTRQFDALIGPPRSSMAFEHTGQTPLIGPNARSIPSVRMPSTMPASGTAHVVTRCRTGTKMHAPPSKKPPAKNATALPMRAESE